MKPPIFIFLFFLSSGLTCFFLYAIVKSSTDSHFPVWEERKANSEVSLATWVASMPNDSISVLFPYNRYVQSVPITDWTTIDRDIKIMDSITGDHFLSLSLFLTAYTDSLLPYIETRLKSYNPDSLLLFMMDIEGYKHAERFPGANQEFYGGVYQFWMSEISNRLDSYSEIDSDVKFDFKYRFLAAKCTENRYGVASKVTEGEKIINNIASSKWSYLLKRVGSAPFLTQVALLVFIFITTLAYIILIRHISLIFKNRHK